VIQDFKAIIDIKTAEILEGNLPSEQLKLVQAWAIIHEKELLENFVNLGIELE
jgi:hypothetical protein